MYFETVDCATVKPSLSSSPWIRGAPHSGFSSHMRRTRSRNSGSILGRPPGFQEDFQRHHARKPIRCQRMATVSGRIRGQGGYHTYRIPSLIVTTKGTVLAFCEGRKQSASDAGDIDLLLRRSRDGGKTWSAPQVVWDDGPNTCGNPCPVIDAKTGTIWLLLTHNLGSDSESKIVDGTSKGTRTVWVTRSDDDGATWARPVEITSTVKRPDWTWYATGPGVGISLEERTTGRALQQHGAREQAAAVARHSQR